MKISRMVCKLWLSKDFRLAYEVKFDLGDQGSFVEEVALDGNIDEKV